MEPETGPLEEAAEVLDKALARARELRPTVIREWAATVARISLRLQKERFPPAVAFDVALEACRE